MKKVVLIHGFASSVNIPALKRKRTAGSEFSVATTLPIEAKIFPWAIPKEYHITHLLDPRTFHRLYQEEQRKTETPETLATLSSFLTKEEPEIVLCHSMGCALLLQLLNSTHPLPRSIKRIIFFQADIPTTLTQKHVHALKEAGIQIENYFCPWDQALLTSMVLHKKLRAGLTGLRGKEVHNTFFPLWRLPNFHVSLLKEKALLRKLLVEHRGS